MKLDSYTNPTPEEEAHANVGSSPMQAYGSCIPATQNADSIVHSGDTAEPHVDNSGITTSPAHAEETSRLAQLLGTNADEIPKMSAEQRNAWMRTQITNFKAQLTRNSPATASAMIDNGTQLNWADALPTSSISGPPYDLTLDGIGNQFNLRDLNSRSLASFNRTSLSISETQLSQNETLVDANFAPSPYLLETLHRRSAALRPASLHSPALQYLFQPGMNPRSSFDSVAAASIRSAASTTREGAPFRRSWQAARAPGVNRTEESAAQNDWQAPLRGETGDLETEQQPSPSPSLHREHRIST